MTPFHLQTEDSCPVMTRVICRHLAFYHSDRLKRTKLHRGNFLLGFTPSTLTSCTTVRHLSTRTAEAQGAPALKLAGGVGAIRPARQVTEYYKRTNVFWLLSASNFLPFFLTFSLKCVVNSTPSGQMTPQAISCRGMQPSTSAHLWITAAAATGRL